LVPLRNRALDQAALSTGRAGDDDAGPAVRVFSAARGRRGLSYFRGYLAGTVIPPAQSPVRLSGGAGRLAAFVQRGIPAARVFAGGDCVVVETGATLKGWFYREAGR